jgi:hypothetical protein
MHPISRSRVETHLAVILLKELPSGFRVLCAEAALIDSLPEDEKQFIRENLLSLQTKQLEQVCCAALYYVEDLDSNINRAFFKGCRLGEYSNLAAIQNDAAIESGRRDELIKMLNKEL